MTVSEPGSSAPFHWTEPTTAAIRVLTLGVAGALAITGLSLGAGGWRLGELCGGLLVLWATTKQDFDSTIVRVCGYVLGAVAIVNSVGLPWTTGPAVTLTIVAIVTGVFGAVDADRRWRDVVGVPLVPVWALGSLGAIYACVPETDHIRWLALAVGALILGEFLLGEPVEAGTTSIVVGLLGWAVLHGGHFRDSAMIAGLSCFGLIFAEPLGAWIVRVGLVVRGDVDRGQGVRGQGLRSEGARGRSVRHSLVPRAIAGAVLIAVQVLGCLAMARNAGLRPTGSAAVVIVVPVLLVLALVGGAIGAVSEHGPMDDDVAFGADRERRS